MGFRPSDCILMRARSAGLPTMAARPPAERPAAERSRKPMSVPAGLRALRALRNVSKKPMRAVV